MAAGVRQPTGRLDWRACSRALAAGHDLRRQRRVDAPRLDRLWKRRLQVHRRRPTWTHLPGLEETHHIGKVAVDPKNPEIVFVAAIGHFYDAHPERGLYRLQNGGRTWSKVLFKNDSVGAVDVVIDPTNPQVVYATLWNTAMAGPVHVSAHERTRRRHLQVHRRRHDVDPAHERSATGLHRTKRHGRGAEQSEAAVTRLSTTFCRKARSPSRRRAAPARCRGAAAAARRVRQPLHLRHRQRRRKAGSIDWMMRARPGRRCRSTPPASRAFPAAAVLREDRRRSRKRRHRLRAERRGVSVEGRRQDLATLRGLPGGDDYHQAWISPDDPNTLIFASDQGAIITRNALADDPKDITWSSWLNQPTAQIDHVSVDGRTPYWVTGAQQDSGAVAVRQPLEGRRNLDARLGADWPRR